MCIWICPYAHALLHVIFIVRLGCMIRPSPTRVTSSCPVPMRILVLTRLDRIQTNTNPSKTPANAPPPVEFVSELPNESTRPLAALSTAVEE